MKIKKISVTIGISLIIAIIVPLLINIAYKHSFEIDWIESEWDAGDMLNFIGELIGGIITLVGVAWTIKDQNEKSREEDTIKYKPILELISLKEVAMCKSRAVDIGFPISYSTDTQFAIDDFYNKMENEKIRKNLLLENVGRGETSNSVLDTLEIREVSWDKESNLYSKTSEQYVGEIIMGGKFLIHIDLPPYIFVSEEMKDDNTNNYVSIVIKVKYNDMFDRMKYRLDLYITLKVTLEKILTHCPVNYKNNFKLGKVNYDVEQIMPSKQIYSEIQKEFVDEQRFYENK